MGDMIYVILAVFCFSDGSCRAEKMWEGPSRLGCYRALRETRHPRHPDALLGGRDCFRTFATDRYVTVSDSGLAPPDPRPTKKPK